MARVRVSVTETMLPGNHADVEGIELTCSRCNHGEEVYGTGENSVKRGLVMMRENCPRGENNFYVRERML